MMMFLGLVTLLVPPFLSADTVKKQVSPAPAQPDQQQGDTDTSQSPDPYEDEGSYDDTSYDDDDKGEEQ
jgi:hypothetical protein